MRVSPAIGRGRWHAAAPLLALLLDLACGGGSWSPGRATPVTARGSNPLPTVGTMVRGPYLQHAEEGVTVVWYTEAPSVGQLHWQSEEGGSGEAASLAGLATRHEAVLTPLIAGAPYTYRVYSARGVLADLDGKAEFSFRAPSEDALRLVVFGDSGLGSPEQYAVARAIAAEPALPDLVMIVGDVIYPPATDAEYDPRFFAPYRQLLPAVPFYAALGNHDYEHAGGRPFFDVFTLPGNGARALLPESTFFLERAGAQIIVHDTNQTGATLRQHAVPWHVEVSRRPAVFRLVAQHHTMYSSGPNGAHSSGLRSVLGPLFSATGVDIVFNGHDHLYERTRAIDGVIYVTTGAGGAELYPRETTNPFTLAFANDRHSYTFVEIRGRTLLLRQTDTTGQGIDALAITKPVVGSDTLRALSGAGAPPPTWVEPGFDDSLWPEAPWVEVEGPTLFARRRFAVPSPSGIVEAVVRVRAGTDYVVRLNGAEVARGDPVDGARTQRSEAFSVPVSLLRAGANALSVESREGGGQVPVPTLELVLISSRPP